MRGANLKLVLMLFLTSLPVALAVRRPAKRAPAPGPAQAPASAQALQNPYAGQRDALLSGKKLFTRYCASCHRLDAQGRGKAPALDTPQVRNAPPGALFWFIKNGDLKRGMPSWSRLPDPQLWQLVTYLQASH